MMATIKTDSKKSALRKLLNLAGAYTGKFVLASVLTIFIAFLGPVRPFLMQKSIDSYISLNDAHGLLMITLLVLLLLLLQSALQVWATILTNQLGQDVIRDLRIKIYQFLTSLKIRFYDQTPVGTLVTRTVNDIETIADIFSEGIINITGDILQIIFLLGLMFYTDWKLTLVSLSVLPLLLYAGYQFKEKVRISFEDVRTQVAKLNTFVQEHIQGMQVVQLFNREEKEMDRFVQINKEHRDANIRSILYYSVFFPVVELIAAISTGLILWYSSHLILQEQATVGTMVAFIMYINLFFRPIRQVADRFNTIQMGMVAANRIFVLIEDTNQVELSGKIIPEKISGEIEYKNVSFSYNGTDKVLHNINFTVHAGKTVALVGATGSGKTTITQLMMQFYKPEEGNIFIDGININELDSVNFRRNTGSVLQDVFLFSGSIKDNIRMFNDSISDEAIIETSKLLGAHEFISKLPKGYDQEVNERGLTLSVGQRQLISFVRAMVNNPSILILDEATASIDHESEEIIQKAIDTMLMGRTCIIIAHRLSTIQHADEILVLNKGRIAESGNHMELLAQNGLYKKLYEVQFSN